MTTKLDPQVMPAPRLTNSANPTGSDGEEVNDMAIFKSRKPAARRARAWDDLSEIDRIMLLESVRHRRRVEEQKRKIYSELYGLRSDR